MEEEEVDEQLERRGPVLGMLSGGLANMSVCLQGACFYIADMQLVF